MADRIKFILHTSAEYFNITCIPDDSAIREFFRNDTITVLAATQHDAKIQFHHKVPTEEDCLLFYKVPQAETNQSDKLVLGLLTLKGGMVKSIYNSVSRVFTPNVSQISENNPKLEGLFENLHLSLGTNFGLPQSGVDAVQNEITNWQQKSMQSTIKADKENIQALISLLEKINNQIRQIDQNSLNTIEEFLDTVHSSLDEIWRLSYHYPQNRMADMMDVICNQIVETCVENMIADDIWNFGSSYINNIMNQVLDIIESWMQICDSLTRLFWPNYRQHPWVGEPHTPIRGQLFKERITEIRNVHNLHRQISTLLEDNNIQEIFEWYSPIKDINLFDTSPVGQKKWRKALNKLEQLLQPIEEKIALAIKLQVQNHLSNPRQVIFIFSKYDTLIQRPTILEVLTPEREQFIQSLKYLLEDLKRAVNDTNFESNTEHLSTICNECRYLKVVQHQIQEIENISYLTVGREHSEELNKAVKNLKEEVDTLLRTNFEIWNEQALTAIKCGELRLQDEQPVVQFEHDGRQLMRVTFHPKLVTFCQDVREFENLGYRVPIELRSPATHAAKFMSYARRLQQIATFHNTIGDRMIPCQRPIMLKHAIELSKLVQSESVAWNDELSVQRYVNTLQDAVNLILAENNTLVGYHEQAKWTVMKLMNIDLLTQGQEWKDEMRHLREIIATLETKGFENLDAFKLHWDYQLYKVLEYQYVSGLIDMNSKLPDINVDLVFRQQNLQYRPPEEELRMKYFSQLRQFIERPLGFRGLSNNGHELFKIMVERNRHHFGQLFKRAEESFKKLNEFKSLWIPWIALGCIDIDELCRSHLKKWEQWDCNFKACKYFSQQLAKIHDSNDHIDCFVINIKPLISDIEFISRKYWEILANSLRASILNDISLIQDYMSSSFQFLQNVPINEDQISESGTRYEKIISELPNISHILQEVQGKNTCLAGWCKERVSALSAIIVQWEQLQPLVDNHSAVLQRQLDIMRSYNSTQLDNLKDEVEKFIMRWQTMISELEINENPSLEIFKERLENWNNIKQIKEKIFADSEKLNIEIPNEVSSIYDSTEIKVETEGEQWKIFENFLHEKNQICNEDWTVYRHRPYILNDFISKWENSSYSSIETSSTRIRKIIENLKNILPIFQLLQSDALTDRHWAQIFHILKKEPKPIHLIKLEDLIDNGNKFLEISHDIQALVHQANSEQIIRQAINELDQWSVTATFNMSSHKDSTDIQISIIKDFQDVINKIMDNQSLLQSAKNSAPLESFADQADLWEKRLNNLETILTSLSQSQRKWIYLEPVFGTGALKSQEGIFKRIDKDFRYIMQAVENDSKILSILKINNISSIVISLENQLSKCQSTLNSYMMEKRNIFPRFYFLGDDDLLEILGQATKLEIIHKHIRKLFPGIQSLTIETSNNTTKITKIHSAEGDSVSLLQSIDIQGSIVNWMTMLETSINKTLREQIKQCSLKANLDKESMEKYPMQVLFTAKAVNFTKNIENGILSMILPSILKDLKKEISILSEMRTEATVTLTKLKIKALLTDLVHYCSIVEILIEKNVTNLKDWYWLQQIKYYLENGTDIVIRIVYADFYYSYEFLGNPSKLVYTSLTHKCYLTLTQSMHLGLGGNPFGRAGTGKTECVKALGSMLGRLVLVFNCDENIDSESMRLILIGLAQCGAWGCFDEFNRLQEATLSAISMLVQPIQTALKEKSENVEIMGQKIQLNQHCGIFVTMNPAGGEYGGRKQLPSNIQSLFRPIVMQQPDAIEIAQVLLFIEGFKDANKFANQIVELFDLASKVLSTQRHYDWGLRELKTTLLSCGKELNSAKGVKNEIDIISRTLRSNLTCKLTATDAQRFEMLINNIFPGSNQADFNDSELRKVLTESFTNLNLYQNEKQFSKCIQLNEMLQKRMGVVVIGSPGSGKTTIISALKEALGLLGKHIKTYAISPKSMNRLQLLGKLDPDTRQWIDGVLTAVASTVAEEPDNINSWILCDGDIDPEWIEALNSVLDDNRLLSLPSGWRIKFKANVNFIFETHDLSHASPATISRLGIINLSPEDIDVDLLFEKFNLKNNFSDDNREYFNQYLMQVVNWITEEGLNEINLPKICLVKSCLKLTQNSQSIEEFCVNLIYGILGFISPEGHNKFANRIFSLAKVYITNPQRAEFVYFDKKRETIEITDDSVLFESNESLKTQLVLTSQAKTYLNILEKFLILEDMPFIITGPSGCGKTILLTYAVTKITNYSLITINCSSQLTPDYISYVLRQNCISNSTARGRELRSKNSKLILFFKNIDLCYIDEWGSCSIIEFLIQIQQKNGFHSEGHGWISILGIQICASITNLKYQNLSMRYLALNSYLTMNYPSKNELKAIIEKTLGNIIKNFKVSHAISNIAESIVNFFEKIQDIYNRNNQFHLEFTPKMLLSSLQNLNYYPSDSFSNALLSEMVTMFSNRLTTSKHLEEFDEAVQQNLKIYLTNHEYEYFIPKGANTSILKSISNQELSELVQKHKAICNAESFIINTPITDELIKQVATLCRLLSREGTQIVIIGEAGCYQIEALYISSTIYPSKIYFLQGSKAYNLIDFYNDLKLAMQSAAIENQNTILLIEHNMISYLPSIMKPIEAILEGSEIIDLLGDELESLASSLKSAAQLEDYQETLSSFYLKRVKSNLHIILNLDINHKNINFLFKKYPTLYKNTSLIWLQPHSKTQLAELTKLVMKDFNKDTNIDVPILFSKCFKFIEKEAPWKYQQFIKSYLFLYSSFDSKIKGKVDKLQNGIKKLSETYKIVDELKSNAAQQEEALAEKRKLANNSLELIAATMRSANDQKTDLLELKHKTQENNEILKEREKAIELELKDVQPILKEASAAVGQIKSEALSEIRSLRAPPEIIRDILEGVLRLMGIRDTSWNSMKSFLAKRGVKEDIRSLDPSRINPEHCEAVQNLLNTKADSFDNKNAKRASVAAAPLANWVKANVRYSKVVQSIKPLQMEQIELQKNLKNAESEIESLISGLDNVDSRVKELSSQLNLHTQEAAMLEVKLEDARNTLKSAEILVSKLKSEYQAWSLQLEEYYQMLESLESNSFMTAFCIIYYTNFSYDERRSLIEELTQELNLPDFQLSKTLVTDQESIIWQSYGLNSDQQNIENAAILRQLLDLPFNIHPIPFIISTSNSVIEWIRKYFQDNDKSFDITSQNSEKFSYTLELAVRFGKILIIEDCEEILPPLLQLIPPKINCKFSKRVIYIGHKLIDLHENFHMILISQKKTINIEHLSPYISVIPFTITLSGLTDQLMQAAIHLKFPHIDEKRIELLKNEGIMLQQKNELEDRLLANLSSAEENILKNEKLLTTLNEIKESSLQIEESLKESTKIKTDLLTQFDQYKNLSSRIAYFTIEISKIYTIKIPKLTEVFLETIDNTIDKKEESKIFHQIVKKTIQYISRTVPKQDYLTLGIYSCKCAYPDEIPNEEWELFVTNFILSNGKTADTFPVWIKREHVSKLASLKMNLSDLYEKLEFENENKWKSFLNATEIIDTPIKTTIFQKILLTQIFHPDNLIFVLTDTIYRLTGISINSFVKPTIQELAKESSKKIPILLKLEPGQNPSADILKTCTEKLGEGHYIELSTGNTGNESFLESFKNATNTGKWVCIKNIHLTPQLFSTVCNLLKNINPNDKFRLWLLSDQNYKIPENLIQNHIEVLFETPNGLKNKLIRLIQQWEMKISSEKYEPRLMKIFIAIFILNSIIQERRHYIPQGWTKWYNFGDVDLSVAIDLMEFCKKNLLINSDWHIFSGLIKQIAYGGEISNIQDLKILSEYIEKILNENILNNHWKPYGFKMEIPTSNKLDEYYKSFEKLSDIDLPEIFGLSPFSNISKNIAVCKHVLKTLQGATLNNDGKINIEKRVRPILSSWKKLASNHKILQLSKDAKEPTSQNPWETFVVAEVKLAGYLFKKIHETLSHLHAILKATINRTEKDEALIKIFANNHVPDEWKRIWSGPKSAIDYIKAIITRSTNAQALYENKLNLDFVDAIDLAGIFNPDSFLSTLKLIISMELQIPVSELVLHSTTTKFNGVRNIKIAPLKIDGATIKNGQIVIFESNKYSTEIFYKDLYITFIQKSDKILKSNKQIKIPLYTNTRRKKQLCYINISTEESSETILLAGAALIIPDSVME